MKMRKIFLTEVWVKGGKRRRLQREEGAIEDVGDAQEQMRLLVLRRGFKFGGDIDGNEVVGEK